jgi:hypothetical protein
MGFSILAYHPKMLTMVARRLIDKGTPSTEPSPMSADRSTRQFTTKAALIIDILAYFGVAQIFINVWTQIIPQKFMYRGPPGRHAERELEA